MRERKDDKDPGLPIYESHPPVWLSKAHGSNDLGYPGFHPPHPGQEEDVLSEGNIKNGFVLGYPVSAETFSAHAVINDNFHSGNDSLTKLEELMDEVFTRRADRTPSIPSSTFRMPSRVTLNDAKRQAWFADLANPDVPLHKLGKSVPHGAKGHDLLDLLQSNNVAIPRAVWFLRVFGANETAGLRNKPTYNPTQYSIDWANVVTSYMKKQLTDIALPSAPRPGLNIKQTFKGVLSDTDSRERWILRFTYCLKLLRTFYSEGMVDVRTFLTWLVQQMAICNLAQAGFVTRLADEYLDDMLTCRALTRPFLDGCLCKLSEIQTSSAQEYLLGTESLLITLVQRICLALPDALVSPKTWIMHSAMLGRVVTGQISNRSAEPHTAENFRDVEQILQDSLADIVRRNEAMLFQSLPPQVQARLGSAVSDVQLLNSICSSTNLDTIQFFENSGVSSTFVSKLDTLLTWSVTPLQYGDHRPFIALTLLRIWRDRMGDRATRRDFAPPHEFLQDRLFDWLDSSDVANAPDNIRAVALIFGKLVKYELFSYSQYIQRLIARGEPGLSFLEDNGSRHRSFLRWIPLHDTNLSLLSQRKVTLHGARTRETPEDLNEREIRKEIRAVLPDLFGGYGRLMPVIPTTILSQCPTLLSAARFEQVRTYTQWLLPLFRKYIINQEQESTSRPEFLKSLSAVIELMAYTKCFRSILDVTLATLEHSTTIDVLTAVIDTFHRYITLWTCMNVTGTIASALYTAHQFWRSRGIQSRALLNLLVEIDSDRHLDVASRKSIAADISAFKLALQPPETGDPNPVPPVLPEILLLAGDPVPEAPSILANGLWFKYRRSSDWAWKVWDNTVASLRQIPVMTTDLIGRQACALRYGSFLLHVDQHIPTGLDDQVLQWFLGPGKNEVAALNADAWDVLTIVLLYLVIHGALKSATILKGLIYPAWQRGAYASGDLGQTLSVYLRAANNLFERLLLRGDCNTDGMPPSNLLDLQCIYSRRQEVYREPHFSFLVTAIPVLVLLENNLYISEDLRRESMALRRLLCEDRDFRQGAYRNLDAVREAFEQPLQTEGMDESVGGPIVAALQSIMFENHVDDVELSSWQDISSLLSPWKLAATAIKLHFSLRQMARALAQESTRDTASASLSDLISKIFHHSMTSEQSYFVAEMARGVGSLVAGKFINNGLKCVTDILNESLTTHDDLTRRVHRGGEILRVLALLVQQLRDEVASLPDLEPNIQDNFFVALHVNFVAIELMLTSNDVKLVSGEDASIVTGGAIFLARLLQFILGFRCNWNAKSKEVGGALCSTIFRIAVLYGSGDHLDLVAFPLLVDTLYYLLDDIASDIKAAAFDPFRNYPEMAASDLPLDMPSDYKSQLCALLSHLPPNRAVRHLASAHRDSSGNLVPDTLVLNRPWEWIENLGEPTQDPKDEEKEREEKERLSVKYVIKNSGSLSLDTFGARMTGDGLLHAAANSTDGRMHGNIRSFEDRLSADSIFQRDWRETRIELEAGVLSSPTGSRFKSEGSLETRGLPASCCVSGKQDKKRGSPASSVLSRSSAHQSMSGSGPSLRQSPGQSSMNRLSTSTVSEIDGETVSHISSTPKRGPKRKAAASVSDDEIEIIEGPLPGPSRGVTKKSKAKAIPKPRGKKK